METNYTALQMSIQRKKDRLKEIDHGKHTPYANQLEVQILQEQIAEDEKLLPTEKEQRKSIYADGHKMGYQRGAEDAAQMVAHFTNYDQIDTDYNEKYGSDE